MMKNDANTIFYRDFLSYKKFLSNLFPKKFITLSNEKEIHIVVAPWMGTAVPWYSITIGLLLSKNNYNVKFVLDDLPFGQSTIFFDFQKRLIRMILKRVSVKLGLEWTILSSYSIKNIPLNLELVNKVAELNSIHFTKGELNKEKRIAYQERIKPQLSKAQQHYKAYIDNKSPSKFLLPGGIWGNSGILLQLCNENNIKAATYDSGDELVLFCHNGVASQLKDIPSVFNKIWSVELERDFAKKSGQQYLINRMQGLDGGFSFFNQNSVAISDSDFYLLLLNSVWDSAALGLHTVYTSYFDWVINSINWVLDHTTSKIVIRKHPAERIASLDNTDNYKLRIAELYEENPRVIFIDSSEDISSYELIKRSKCVLGFSSTAIVESVAFGIPSIIVSSAYYANLGVSYSACNNEQYYNYLFAASENRLDVSEEMKEKAYVINHITQRCNWVKTQFTPQPKNYQTWVKYNSIEPFESDLVIQSIIQDIPTSYLKHKIYFASENS
jgi:hypothetical protein